MQSRLNRQESLLEREDPPFVWALLDENVLDWQAGGAEVFRIQLAHLHELSKRPNIGVRVIPKSAGVHLGADGAFQIVTYENRAAAYAGARHGGRVIESPMDVREFVLDWECMSQMALSDDLSRAKISEKLEALG